MPDIVTDANYDTSANPLNIEQNPSAIESFIEGKIAHRFAVKVKNQLKIMYDAASDFDITDASYGRFIVANATDFNNAKTELDRYLTDASNALVYNSASKLFHITSYKTPGKELDSAVLRLDYLISGSTVSDAVYVSNVKISNLNADIQIIDKFLAKCLQEIIAAADAQNEELLNNPVLFGYSS